MDVLMPTSADRPEKADAGENTTGGEPMRSGKSKPEKLPGIPSLTGVRFFAAIFVVQSHIFDNAIKQGVGDVSNEVYAYFLGIAALGMSLFFVLSGFVIHYNYREAILKGGPVGYWNFFVARFSRLYPLYLVLVLTDLYLNGMMGRAFSGDVVAINALVQAAPQYLTLTQTWTFGVVGDNNMVYQLGQVAQVAWSISAEWFFYFCYPVLCIAMLWLPRPWMKFAVMAVFSIIVIRVLMLILANAGQLQDFGIRNYGLPAAEGQDSLFRWAIYFAPYSRVTEFIVGVLICGAYLDVRNKPLNILEKRAAPVLPFLTLALIGVVHWLMWTPAQPFPILTQLHMCFGYALPCAVLIWCVVRYKGPLAAALAWKPMVFVGEISYSIYLIHIMIIGAFTRGGLAKFLPAEGPLALPVRAIVLIAAVIAVSTVTYYLIEVPARNWLRRTFAAPSRPPAAPHAASLRALFIITRTVVLLVAFAFPLAILVTKPAAVPPPPPPGTVEVVSATYGETCGVAKGNATVSVRAACNSRKQCTYVVDVYALGDPAGGCGKDFTAEWRCGPDAPVQTGAIPAEAGLGGKSVQLSCN